MKTARGRDPTRGQLLAMAYVDGELAESARQEFEDRLRRELALMREVAELKRLVLLVSQMVSVDPVAVEHEGRCGCRTSSCRRRR